ncbi:MAG: hypothetical protein Q9214_004582 [Letrouitia sp. 1 TL-2023]
MTPTRIAVLECDPLIASIRNRYGNYGDIVTGFLQAGANHLGLPLNELEISTWDVEAKQEFPALEEIDTILVTGSNLRLWRYKKLFLEDGLGLSAYDDVDWINHLVEYIKEILAQERIKVIGLCFGHQIIGRALGAKAAINSLGYELSVCDVVLAPLGVRLFGKSELPVHGPRIYLAGIPWALTIKKAIHQMHHDIICSYPAGVSALGMSPACEVQGMFVPGTLLTLQGHPEFNNEIMLELLKASKDLGFKDEALIDDAMSRVNNKHDGTLVAAVLLKFVKGTLKV